MKSFLMFFRELFTSQGRIGRGRFFLNCFFIYIFAGLMQAIFLPILPFVGLVATLIAIAWQVGTVIRRLHDLNWAWTWVILIAIPIANIILLLILLFKKGATGNNKYGTDPLAK